MGCDGNGVGGAMELLKAFKSPFSSRVGKKNLLSTYSKILFRFNFLRLPYYQHQTGRTGPCTGRTPEAKLKFFRIISLM